MKTIISVLHRVENAVLVLLLLAMILLAGFDILARTFAGSGVVWIPPILRVMVLWLGLLGALYATRSREHISIDILSRWLSPKTKLVVNCITTLFAAVVCAVIAWHSHIFVSYAYEFGDMAFANIPVWPLQAIIPVTFSLMTLRFVIHVAIDIRSLLINSNSVEEAA